MIYSLQDIIAAIQDVNVTIAGVKAAPTVMPAALNTADLPCALVFVGDFVGTQQAIGMSRCNETFIVRVYVRPIAQGQGVDQGYQEMLELLQAFIDKYHEQQQTGGMFGGLAEQVRDFSGNAAPLMFAGTLYHGFEIRLEVVQK